MKINIKQKPEQIEINFSNETIIVSETSEDWNSTSINNFLLKLSSATPDGEKLEMNPERIEGSNNNDIFDHIEELFQEFCDEYNSSIKIKEVQHEETN